MKNNSFQQKKYHSIISQIIHGIEKKHHELVFQLKIKLNPQALKEMIIVMIENNPTTNNVPLFLPVSYTHLTLPTILLV